MVFFFFFSFFFFSFFFFFFFFPLNIILYHIPQPVLLCACARGSVDMRNTSENPRAFLWGISVFHMLSSPYSTKSSGKKQTGQQTNKKNLPTFQKQCQVVLFIYLFCILFIYFHMVTAESARARNKTENCQ